MPLVLQVMQWKSWKNHPNPSGTTGQNCYNGKKTVNKLESDMEKTNGHIVKLKSDVGKNSNELNSFKLEMDKHLERMKVDMEKNLTSIQVEIKDIQKTSDSKLAGMDQPVREMKKDMQKLRTEVNNAKGEVDKKLTVNGREMNDLSNKFKEIFEGQESGSWSEIVKREVTSTSTRRSRPFRDG